MFSKKILTLIFAVGVVIIISSYVLIYHPSAIQNIKVMAYRSSAQKNETGYQIDKYESIESVAWINDNEVLTLTKKGDFKNPDSTIPIRYCSIYNLNTKISKDFKDVNIADFMGVSPDKKYVIYAEARIIPKIGSEEWLNSSYSGDLFHKNVKLLNLSTGEITKIDTELLNCNAEFIWVSNNKILVNYLHHWKIIDINKKVYAKGSYNAGKGDAAWISGVDDIKDLGNSVEGKFYYTQSENGKKGVKLCTLDVKTKEIKAIFSNKFSLNADKKSKTIIIDNYNNNGEISPEGVFVNRTFGALIMDESGTQLQDIKLPKGRIETTYVLSPDGSKVAYLEYSNDIDPDPSIKVIDTKTGAINEILKFSNLKDKDSKTNTIDETIQIITPPRLAFSNICWDSTSTSLSFTSGNSHSINSTINTYIVSFDK